MGKINGNPTDETTAVEYTGFDTTQPPTHLGADVTFGGVTQGTNEETVNMDSKGVMVNDWGDTSGSGYLMATNTDFEATIDIAPYVVKVADEAVISGWRAGTTAVYSSPTGSVAGNIITLTASSAQRSTVGKDSGDDGITGPITFNCTGYPTLTIAYT